MIAKDVKSNSIAIIRIHEYDNKVDNLISKDHFNETNAEPTNNFRNMITKPVKASSFLIHQEHKWKDFNVNPTAPTIRRLMAIHKLDYAMRPVVNWSCSL